MGASGWTVKLEKIRDDASTDSIEERREDLIEIFGNFYSFYAQDAAPEIDYFYEIAYGEHFLYLDESSVSFMFKDWAPTSASKLEYWSRVAFACYREEFEAIFIDCGFTITSEHPIREALKIGDHVTSFFIPLRGRLWSYYPKYGGELSDDDDQILVEELTDEERETLNRIVASKWSGDSVTRMIAPDENFYTALLELSRSKQNDQIGSAMWYGGNLSEVTSELLTACLEAAPHREEEQLRWDARKIEKMASRTSADALFAIREALKPESPLATKALATAAVVGFERDDVDTSLLKTNAIKNGLGADAPYCDVAVSYLSSLAVTGQDRLELAELLTQRLEEGVGSSSTEHDFILAIVNLFIHDRGAPPKAVETLKKFAAIDGHQAQAIAAWGLDLFS